VNRGGSWNNNPHNCRAANRNRNTPTNRNNNVGFRLARSSTLGRMATDEQVLVLLLAHRLSRDTLAETKMVVLTIPNS